MEVKKGYTGKNELVAVIGAAGSPRPLRSEPPRGEGNLALASDR
jgi:hypothetical protein